jgi:ABC-type glycerol-3-phosphate transport system substrate-binding protein
MQLPTTLTRRQAMIVLAIVVIVIGGLLLFVLNMRSTKTGIATANLTIWGTDSPQAFNDMISKYTGPGSGTQATIKYTQITASNYRSQILAAIAAGTGPDIFEIGNRDLPQWQSVLAPLPATLAQTFNMTTLGQDFPDVVSKDFVSGGNIYALPLSVDTLAMIYNKDLLNTAGIATLPSTWTQFDADVPLLRKVNAAGQLTQAAVALGGSEASIPDAPDIVFLLMLQNGTPMVSTDGSSVAFAGTGGSSGTAGQSAFDYYLQFANASSPYYTWNDTFGNAEDSFAQGKTAIIFDYASALAAIKAKAPFLNYGVAPMPQPANATVAVNYADYNGLAVNRNSPNALAAWNFIIGLTTNPAYESIYTKDTGLPPALRTSIATDQTDPVMSVFASQALTATSWYEMNSEAIDAAMNTAIQTVLSGAADSTTALQEAQTTINGS